MPTLPIALPTTLGPDEDKDDLPVANVELYTEQTTETYDRAIPEGLVQLRF